MNSTVDGEFQKYAVESGDYIREHFFGPDPRLQRMVEHLSDDELRTLPRGGHDYRKLYAAYKMAVEHEGSPTVILAKTIKGWTLGADASSRATRRTRSRSSPRGELKAFRDRLQLPIPDAELEDGDPPYWHPGTDSPEYEYMMARRRALDGPVPERVVRKKTLTLPAATTPTPTCSRAPARRCRRAPPPRSPRLLRNLLRDPEHRHARRADHPRRSAHVRSRRAVPRRTRSTRRSGSCYEPVDAELLLSYREASNGRILEEGITEAGSMASFTAAGTVVRDVGPADDPVLHLLFDVRVPARRRPHLVVRRPAGPRVPARRHRRPHHARRRGAAALRRPEPAARRRRTRTAARTTRRSRTRWA